MPYSITTKDGITIQNIPDDIDPQSDVLRQRVEAIRGGQDVPAGDVPVDTSGGDVSAVDRLLGGLEAGATMVSGALAQPLSGLAGIGAAIIPGGQTGPEAIQATQEALTFQPRTEAGQESLQAVGETLQPLGEAIQGVETTLGQTVQDVTGSEVLAAGAATLPTALLELIGFKGAGSLARSTKRVTPSVRSINNAIKKAAPDSETIKNASRVLYNELDNSGVTMKPKVFEGMVNKIRKATKKAGLDPRTTPKAAGALEAMQDVVGTSPTLTEIDTLRKVAQAAAKNIDPTEKALGVQIINGIDDFLDQVSPKGLTKGSVPAAEVSAKYKAARQLWGRATKSEKLQDVLEVAKTQASGLENGIRIGLDKILRSKKQSKFFTEAEKTAMRNVVKGDVAQNFSKLVGRFGFSEGRATNIIGGSLGVGGGLAATGSIEGAVVAATVGQTARKIAQVLTKNKAEFVESIVRAGPNAREITKTYLSAVPKSKRSVNDLADLLSDPQADLTKLTQSSNKMVKEAAQIAEGRKSLGALFGTLAPTALQENQ